MRLRHLATNLFEANRCRADVIAHEAPDERRTVDVAFNPIGQVVGQLTKGPSDIPTLVGAIYIGLDPRLTKAAGRSVLAHLEDLVSRKLVSTEGAPSIEGVYRLL